MKPLNLTKNTKVYVACPINAATGGPELLHQTAYELRKLGMDAQMFYYQSGKRKKGGPVHENYKMYRNPYATKIEDNPEHVMIVPEVNTELLYRYKNLQRVMWWLSVDNYYHALAQRPGGIRGMVERVKQRLGLKRVFDFDPAHPVKHFVQSEYARQHLLAKGITEIFFLSDYLSEAFLGAQTNHTERIKKDVVAYNPAKGMEVTQRIQQTAPDIPFIPLRKMTPHEVAETLASSKVYIDFGPHPGKDRIPREAAALGCCVITNKKGAAKYFEDVPIPDEFKFENEQDTAAIVAKIRGCFSHYAVENEKYAPYRAFIHSEQTRFIADLRAIFYTEV